MNSQYLICPHCGNGSDKMSHSRFDKGKLFCNKCNMKIHQNSLRPKVTTWTKPIVHNPHKGYNRYAKTKREQGIIEQAREDKKRIKRYGKKYKYQSEGEMILDSKGIRIIGQPIHPL